MPFLSALFYIRRETKRIYGEKLMKYLKLLHRFILLLVLQLVKKCITNISFSLQWRHNRCNSVSNHQPHGCLLNRLFKRRAEKHQTSASLVFVRGIHRRPVSSPHTWPVTRKMFPSDDVIMPLKPGIGILCHISWDKSMARSKMVTSI